MFLFRVPVYHNTNHNSDKERIDTLSTADKQHREHEDNDALIHESRGPNRVGSIQTRNIQSMGHKWHQPSGQIDVQRHRRKDSF